MNVQKTKVMVFNKCFANLESENPDIVQVPPDMEDVLQTADNRRIQNTRRVHPRLEANIPEMIRITPRKVTTTTINAKHLIYFAADY